jgi:hypothetical protein
LEDYEPVLNNAFLFLEEVNALDWHDHMNEKGDYELIRFIDQQIHPTYLRLIEGVLGPLLRPVAYFSRIDRNRGTEGLDVWAVIQEVSRTALSEMARSYKHIVRNGIAHGGITFLQNEIRYHDKRGNEEKYGDTEIIRICDDLLDHCNGMALAYKVFFLTHYNSGYNLPSQLSLEELREETKAPWWNIEGSAHSEITGQKQLIIYSRANTRDYGKVQYSAFQSGVLAELFSPGYDRYFFSIRSDLALPGWAGFDGVKLSELRRKGNAQIIDYRGVLENDLVFYVPRIKLPRFLARLHTISQVFRLKWPLAAADFRKQLGRPTIFARNAAVHRNGWGCVLNGAVVVSGCDVTLDQDMIRKSCRRIVQTALRHARRKGGYTRVARYLPIGFARISVFRKDYRRSRLNNFGIEQDLVGTVQLQRIRRIRSPDIFGSTIEKRGKYRIAWNRSWLDRIDNEVEVRS